ncbi:SRPBCC family protein [Planctopirus hydrillae]|uniref:Uncharacterized protein n=1 Tax=Planctopirus hydrillae TaxID=1841610 RepID=A0A1C3E8B7_9PLAN|nr:SRPBCC family protein [Planctopirus hydrillae]ODA29399.1 hypothetical protein A6X21_08890 [Planctopirus hydrillae]
MPQFESQVQLPAAPEKIFDFISRPKNLASLSPPEAGLVFVEAPEVLSLGSIMVCRVQAYGVVQQLEQKITVFNAPVGFREELIKGPIKSYIHDYIIEQQDDELCVLKNRIEFEPPGGLIGLMVTADKILDQLEDAFAYRRQMLVKAFS